MGCSARRIPSAGMTLQETQLLLQTISSFAIAGGLIFTAIQFRKSRSAAHVTNFSRLVELQLQLRKMRVEDPTLANVYVHDLHGLHSPEEVRQYFFNLMQLSLFEIAWYSHKHGQLADDYYQSWINRLDTIASEESFRKMMASPAMKILHDEFQTFVEDRMAKQSARATT